MSLTIERPLGAKDKRVLTNIGLPQVNLLPPEVRAARGLVNVKRWLGLALVAIVIVAALAFGFVKLLAGQATAELESAQEDTARLQQEQAKYAEVPSVLNDLKRTQDARTQGTSTEILWRQRLDAIAAVLPAGVSIDTFTVTQSTPWMSASTSADPLISSGVGTVLFTVRTATLPDSSSWLDALNTVPGFADATFTSAAVTATDGLTYYNVTTSVQVLDSAYALRFPASTEEN
ncbi:PilN domain-containing protein [Cellulomonas sp.]|uniref:PilN domain-containing protein n=1 Tax=Cellulomonas sp. TaxID=40001 RepID=UPI003BACD616